MARAEAARLVLTAAIVALLPAIAGAIPFTLVDSFPLPPGPRPHNWSGLATHNDALLAYANSGDFLYTLDPVDGTVLGVVVTDITNGGSIAVGDGRAFVGDNNDIHEFDLATGSFLATIPANDFGGGMEYLGGWLYYSDEAGTTYRIDPNDGAVHGSFASGAPHLNGMATDGLHLYAVNSQDGTPEDLIRMYDPASGAVLDQFFAPSRECYGLTFLGNRLYAIDEGLKRVLVLEQTDVYPPDPNQPTKPAEPVVPEPSPSLLFVLGILVFAWMRFRLRARGLARVRADPPCGPVGRPARTSP